jgi:hypothetical protein
MIASEIENEPAVSESEIPSGRFSRHRTNLIAGLLLTVMALLAIGSSEQESVTVDEVAHIGAGVSYLQRLDLRLNEEHPPLAKVLAALPLVCRGIQADYSSPIWALSADFSHAHIAQTLFGDWLLNHWNDQRSVLRWARAPMIGIMLALGITIFQIGRKLGGDTGGLLSLIMYTTYPIFLGIGPLVHTDVASTLFILLTLWTAGELFSKGTAFSFLKFSVFFAAALLTKFSAILLFLTFPIIALAEAIHSAHRGRGRSETDNWHRGMRSLLKGSLVALLITYAVYLVLSIQQPLDPMLPQGEPALIRRLLMPVLLFLRGLFYVVAHSSRPMYLLGRHYHEGVWYYFPVVFGLKTPFPFLTVLAMTCVLTLYHRNGFVGKIVPSRHRIQWLALLAGLCLYTFVCLTSKLAIGIRHFSVPMVLMIIFTATLPKLIEQLQARAAAALCRGVIWMGATFALITSVIAFPNYLSYFNPVAMVSPVYRLVGDSNVDWNQSLVMVRQWAIRHGVSDIAIDQYGWMDPASLVPGARLWDCQRPSQSEAGKWVVISTNMIEEGHNCNWLLKYPAESIGGGSMWAVKLPASLPLAGAPGGPPAPSEARNYLGLAFDLRKRYMQLSKNPAELSAGLAELEGSHPK